VVAVEVVATPAGTAAGTDIAVAEVAWQCLGIRQVRGGKQMQLWATGNITGLCGY
jgi:hypothetical protein